MSNLNRCLTECIERGYVILPDGTIKGLTKILKLSINKNGYEFFTFRDLYKKREVVLVHRLQAFMKFGDKIFDKEIVVRHLDGNSKNNSWNNILIGTSSDNQMDRDPECRRKSATLATRKMQDNTRNYNERSLIYKDLKNNIPYSEIMKKHNVSSKGTLSFMKNKSIEYQEYLKK